MEFDYNCDVMAYFDYSANYPVNDEVLEEFVRVEKEARGNANSIHQEGKESLRLYEEANQKVFSLLHLNPETHEIIYTSSATESNNTVIKGVFTSYLGNGNKMLASEFEHSSTNAALSSLKDKGTEIELVKSDEGGKIDLRDLSMKLTSNTILTCLSMVEGELGAKQPTEEVQRLVHESTNGFLLVDATQALGKFDVDLSKYDFVSFAPHKFGGIIGTGVLIKRKDIILSPLLNGGSSVSIYRSGTPAIGLIASVAKALEIALAKQSENEKRTRDLWELFFKTLGKPRNILVNSFAENPFVINLSIPSLKGGEIVKKLDQYGFEVSQKSACSIPNTPSKAVMSVYHDKRRALSSFRISLSSLSKEEDVISLANCIKDIANGTK